MCNFCGNDYDDLYFRYMTQGSYNPEDWGHKSPKSVILKKKSNKKKVKKKTNENKISKNK